jgi:DNA-binding GntR family transcriptional regulator
MEPSRAPGTPTGAASEDAPERRRVRAAARRRPLADEVRDRIAADFLAGEDALAPGARLPGELELSRRYDVSRVTLRSALRSLQEAGFIAVRHGSGATVLPRTGTVLSGLDRLSSFETFAREAGEIAGTEDMELERLTADDELAARLEIAPGDPVTVVRRAKTFGGARVAYMVAWVPEAVVPAERLAAEFRGSVLDVLYADPAIGVEYADCEIAPVALQPAVAGRLAVKTGTVALYMNELARTAEGLPLEWGECWFLPEHFRFTLRRRRRFAP